NIFRAILQFFQESETYRIPQRWEPCPKMLIFNDISAISNLWHAPCKSRIVLWGENMGRKPRHPADPTPSRSIDSDGRRLGLTTFTGSRLRLLGGSAPIR